jgi:uncharacterized integral membrane protein
MPLRVAYRFPPFKGKCPVIEMIQMVNTKRNNKKTQQIVSIILLFCILLACLAIFNSRALGA